MNSSRKNKEQEATEKKNLEMKGKKIVENKASPHGEEVRKLKAINCIFPGNFS